MLTFTRPFHASSTRARLLAILLLILDANGSAEAIGASCPPGRFLRNVSAVYCDGMTGVEAPDSAEACANYCCANSTCGVWLWCPDSGNGGGCTQWRSKRCHIGPSSTACSTQSHWFGQSDTPPPPTPPAPPPVTRKRGFSGFLGPEYTCDDAAALSLDNSWFYNWLHVPSQYGNCNGKRQAAEYVPMVIGINVTVAPDTPAIWEAANARYLLGYNEPDFGNGHNHPHMCSPEEAAKDWHRLQSLATSTSPPLELVSPAVSTTGVNHNGESSWLDRFFANCTVAVGCDPTMIKYVAFHDYSGDPQLILARAEGMYKRYQRKVWITGAFSPCDSHFWLAVSLVVTFFLSTNSQSLNLAVTAPQSLRC